MSAQCVVALYESFDEAKAAIRALEEADYPRGQVSFVTHSVKNEVPKEDALQYGDKTERNAAKGAGVGGLLGLLLGSPLLAVSGVGAVLIAGPIATGLAGAIVGGFLGAMSGWGVHVDHVRRYEKEVAAGSLLVVAQGDPQQVAQAERILQQTDAQEVHLHAETSADSVDR
jgi:hypothetical protein